VSIEGERPADHAAAEAVAVQPRRRITVDTTPLRQHRDFRLLWIGKGISLFGSQITLVAVPFQVYDLTESSLAVGLVALCQLVPIVSLSFWGGAVADAVDRRKVLIRSDSILIVITALLALNAFLPDPSVAAIYVLATCASGVYCFGRPALEAAIPRVVPQHQLAAASALNGVQGTTAMILGPAVGGVLIGVVGAGGAFLLDSVTYGAGLIAGLLMRPVPPAENAPKPSWAAIKEGFSYVRRSQALLGTYWVDIAAMVFGMPDALLPALAVERFGGGPGILGLLLAAPPAGAFVASLLSGWTGRVRRHGLAILVAACVWGSAIAVFGLVESLPLALLAAAVAGAGDMISGIFRMTMWNTIVPDELRGRLAGVELAAYAGGPALGNFEAGLVASLTSLRVSIVSGGVACVVAAVLVCLMLPGFLRYRAPDPEPTPASC
jgi:MFS family permease